MGHQFTIEGDEAFALAQELAALTGESLDAAVTAALRDRVEAERARLRKVEKMLTATAAFRGLLDDPPPSSDHGWLYDDKTGLPI